MYTNLQMLSQYSHIATWLLPNHTGGLSNGHILLIVFDVEKKCSKLQVIHCQGHSPTSKGTVDLAHELVLTGSRLHREEALTA